MKLSRPINSFSGRIRRPVVTAIAVVGSLTALWVVAGVFAFVAPAAGRPQRADAIVVLAPTTTTGRLNYAEKLLEDGWSENLVISVPQQSGGETPANLCEEKHTYQTICFVPDPVTTQGEARVIERLAEERNWHTITVITNDSHLTRARIIIQRCYKGNLNMLAVRQDNSLAFWAYRFLYETGALIKASSERSC